MERPQVATMSLTCHTIHRERLRATRQDLAEGQSVSPLALILGQPEARLPRSISGKHHLVCCVVLSFSMGKNPLHLLPFIRYYFPLIYNFTVLLFPVVNI